jgi:DNA transformation protein and related proteins
MAGRSASHLHVRLSASQARKRLAGRGFGVRRVETTGRNESVVVHTATGRHLRQLESLFRDVIVPSGESAPRDEEE